MSSSPRNKEMPDGFDEDKKTYLNKVHLSSQSEIKEEIKDTIKISPSLFIGENKRKFRDNYKIGHIIGSGMHFRRLVWRSTQMPAHQN